MNGEQRVDHARPAAHPGIPGVQRAYNAQG